MMKIIKKVITGIFLSLLFLLPFFNWISAEPVNYQDPEGYFSILSPEGWLTDDSGKMGRGVFFKGPETSREDKTLIHLTHEPAGIVALDVQWHAHLGRLRYDLERVQFHSLEDFEDQDPPYDQARYSYVEGGQNREALVRMVFSGARFYLMTASCPQEDIERLTPVFLTVFDSLRPGGKK